MILPRDISVFPPGGFVSPERPLSLWRLQRALLDSMADAVLGSVPIEHWFDECPRLCRHFFDTPRRRSCQSFQALLLSPLTLHP